MAQMTCWRIVGIEFHWRYREGGTWLDLRHNSYLSHWGFYSIEYERKRQTIWRMLRLAVRRRWCPGCRPETQQRG